MPSIESRISKLEKLVEKQAFQIKVLQKLSADYDMFGVFDQVLSYDLNENEYNRLREITVDYSKRIDNGIVITLEQFSDEMKIILKEKLDNKFELEKFISIWLNGPNGGFGFSKKLYNHLYKKN